MRLIPDFQSATPILVILRYACCSEEAAGRVLDNHLGRTTLGEEDRRRVQMQRTIDFRQVYSERLGHRSQPRYDLDASDPAAIAQVRATPSNITFCDGPYRHVPVAYVSAYRPSVDLRCRAGVRRKARIATQVERP